MHTRSIRMPNIIKRILLTPSQAAEKESIIDKLRINPLGPWVNGKKMSLPKAKQTISGIKKKK
jgi:hypothetical protein